ncbi:cobalamin-binding protein [Rheinheimera maricola]|uniref:Cobalamin-binding protein n=1 Tax=Rheinheimera maricola TaxID=2793282 RepID=A0ABS7X6E6_9GAMM|nr:cobalamin-binding protein [Rheinheimera maricola]
MRLWLLLLCCLSAAVQGAEQRIIALAPHITEMLYAIGAGDSVVGVSDYSDYPAQARALPSVASFAGINLEAILALKPNLVIAWRSGNPPADIKRLQHFGINVVFSDPITLDDIATELRLFGELTGHQIQADAEAARFSHQLQQLRTTYQHKTPLRVFFAMSTAPLSTVANKAWPQQMLTLCGADNPFATAKGDYPQVGIEQVVTAEPELIIQPLRTDTKPDLMYWHRFTVIPAVKHGRFLSVNADHLYRTTPRTLLGIQQLCQGIDSYRDLTINAAH